MNKNKSRCQREKLDNNFYQLDDEANPFDEKWLRNQNMVKALARGPQWPPELLSDLSISPVSFQVYHRRNIAIPWTESG